MSIDPRSLNRPSTIAASVVLCSSRPARSVRPKENSKRSGIHSAPSSDSFSSQIWRSCDIAAISSCHTRSMAGLSRSYSRSWTSRMAAVSRCCASARRSASSSSFCLMITISERSSLATGSRWLIALPFRRGEYTISQ